MTAALQGKTASTSPRPSAETPPPRGPLRRGPAPRSSFAAALRGTLPNAKAKKPATPPTASRQPVAPRPETTKREAKQERRPVEEERRVEAEEIDPLDPAARRAAMLAPPTTSPAPPPAPIEAAAPVAAQAAPSPRLSLEEIVPQLVRRIAWGGDKRKGSVRLEIGAGAYAGSTITLHAEDGRVRLDVSGANADAVREKLDARLRRKGLVVES